MKMENSNTHFTSVPAFLSKLWALVDDSSTDDLIYWDVTGRSFHVSDQVCFSKNILPMYFKHNNISSFIRQLNMYGFRKVMASDSLSLKCEKEDLEFAHRCFVRGQEFLLEAIKRKTSTQPQPLPPMSRSEVGKIIGEVSSLKTHIEHVTESLESIKLENDILWKEMIDLRQKHARQQEIVSKLVQFFASIINDRTPIKRKLPLMLRNFEVPTINEIHEPETLLLATDLPDFTLASTTPLWNNKNDTPTNLFVKQEPKLVLNRDFSREEIGMNLDTFQDSLDSIYELLNNTNQYNIDPPMLKINDLSDFVDSNDTNEEGVQAKRRRPNEEEINSLIEATTDINATGKELAHYTPPDEWLSLPQSSLSSDPLNDKDLFKDYVFEDEL